MTESVPSTASSGQPESPQRTPTPINAPAQSPTDSDPQTPAQTAMTTHAETVIEQLKKSETMLHAYSDKVWAEIDHNDSEALDEGVAFKKLFNQKLRIFEQSLREIEALIRSRH